MNLKNLVAIKTAKTELCSRWCLFFSIMPGALRPSQQFFSDVGFSYFCRAGIFLGLIWGRIMAPIQFKNEQKLPKMVYIIPNFLFLHFGANFMKI